MTSTIYRRQSMAQLYEKLRAQGDDDDMTWLDQYTPDDKFDEPYVPVTRTPPSLSPISSVSPVSSYSSPSSISDPGFDTESSDNHFNFDSDSDSDVDPEPLSLDLPCTAFNVSPRSPLILEPDDLSTKAEPLDSRYSPSVREVSLPQSRSTPRSVEYDSSPVPVLRVPSIASRRTTRHVQRSFASDHSPVVPHDEDVYSESDGNGSEDEYIPSPNLDSKKRHRSTRSAPVTSSQKRIAQSASRKRPRHSPLARNAQAALGISPASPVAKSNNPWACPHCKWVQRNHRTPDLKRHIRTHTRLQRPARWVCCGVPIKDAKNYNVSEHAESYIWGGEEMIGGCCKEFSRRDALKRHLDNDHINCVGNFAAFSNICEDEI